MRDDDVTTRLYKVAQHDWENSLPLDLSDEGLLADLGDRYADGVAKLGLEPNNPKQMR